MTRDEDRAVAALQHPQERRVALPQLAPGQHQQAKRGRDRQRDEHRDQHRKAVGDDQRLEERPREVLEEEHRDDRDDVDDGRVGDRRAHLDRGVEHDSEHRRVASFGPCLTQASHDVLHIDDRVVDHHPDRDDQSREDHHVDGRVAYVEHEDRREQRQRDRDQADEGGPPLEQEGDDDQDHEQDADQQRPREIVDRLLDEGRGPEDRGVDLHAREAPASSRRPRPRCRS